MLKTRLNLADIQMFFNCTHRAVVVGVRQQFRNEPGKLNVSPACSPLQPCQEKQWPCMRSKLNLGNRANWCGRLDFFRNGAALAGRRRNCYIDMYIAMGAMATLQWLRR
jgi:hypothetical protein